VIGFSEVKGHAKAMPRDEKSQRGGCESLAMLTFAVVQQLCLLHECNSDLTCPYPDRSARASSKRTTIAVLQSLMGFQGQRPDREYLALRSLSLENQSDSLLQDLTELR
jgi:hypothetical protein